MIKCYIFVCWHSSVNTWLSRWMYSLNKMYFLWCFTGRNPNGCWLLLSPFNTWSPLLLPSVWLLQESNKRRIRCCISQGRDPCSALWQRQTVCWGLIYTLWTLVKKNKKQMSWQHGVWLLLHRLMNSLSNQLTQCRKIQSDTYCTELRKENWQFVFFFAESEKL